MRTFSEVAPNEPVRHVRHSADCSFNRQQADDHGFSMRLSTDLECRTVISLYFPPPIDKNGGVWGGWWEHKQGGLSRNLSIVT